MSQRKPKRRRRKNPDAKPVVVLMPPPEKMRADRAGAIFVATLGVITAALLCVAAIIGLATELLRLIAP